MEFREAIIQENLNVIKDILIHEPNKVEEVWEGRKVPFHAAATGNLMVMRYLVEYSRASFNETDNRNRTTLHYAVEAGKLPLVQYLTERVGLSPVYGDENMVTPYQLAYEKAKDTTLAPEERANYQEIEDYFAGYCGARFQDMYQNPILRGMHPDPSIIRVGEDYYMVNSSFIFFPCIPISHSKDLIHWELIGHAITNPEWAENLNTLEGGRGYWAPDISYNKGRFYITATFRLNDDGTVYRKQMVTSSDKPEGPYCEPVYLEEDGIDPSIFTDDDGRRYMVLNRGARIFEISVDGKEKLSDAELLYYGDYKRAPEGSHLLKKDGWYYLFEAEGGTGIGHRITVSRSRTLKGVYQPCPYNPIMRQMDEKGVLQRCGHGKPVCTQNGEWYIVYLCVRQRGKEFPQIGRETALDPITWTADGWPLINNGDGPSVLQKKPNLPEWIPPEDKESYVTPRVPEKGTIQISEKEIMLCSCHASLSTTEARSILVRRQKETSSTLEVMVEIPQTLMPGEEFGITGYYDENTYLTFGPRCMEGGYKIGIKEHIGDTDKVQYYNTKEILPGTKLGLKMVTEGIRRSFYIKLEGFEWDFVATLDQVDYICDEGWHIGKRFTGPMEGIYACTEREERIIHFGRF